VQRHAALHEFGVGGEPHQVFGEELVRRHRADAAGIERRGVRMAPFHQAEHFARQPAHDKSFTIERTGERVQRGHDVGDRAEAVIFGVRRFLLLRLGPHAGIGLLHHALAKIDPDQIVLKEVVVEHVLGRFAEIDDPLGHRRRLDAVRHVLRIDRAGRVIVAADAADPAGDEMRVARILALQEHAVAAKHRRRAVALGDFTVLEVDFGEDAEIADDAGDRVPVLFDERAARFAGAGAGLRNGGDVVHSAVFSARK